MGPLGRNQPPDWEHVEKYPLRALTEVPEREPHEGEPTTDVPKLDLTPKNVPVAFGINWYDGFDQPVQDSPGVWVAHLSGSIRGGHCICLEPAYEADIRGHEQDPLVAWWTFYNQGQQGSCVGHGVSRQQGLVYRKRFDAVWLYNEAQKIDGDPNPHEGTTVRAGLEVLRQQGHRVAHGPVTTNVAHSDPPNPNYGVTAYRWATTAEEVVAALGYGPDQRLIPFLNSWGRAYPHICHFTVDDIARLLAEAGEAGVVTDR